MEETYNNLQAFEVGKPYPIHNLANGSERCLIQINAAFIDILFYSSNAKEDAKFWGKSILKLYLFMNDSIPFILVRFPTEDFDFDMGYNFLKVDPEARDLWLNQESNTITLYLIDAKTNIIRSMRYLGIDFQKEFKGACKSQLVEYTTAKYVDSKILEIQSKYSTSEMIKLSRLK